jgi:hypothetical protein
MACRGEFKSSPFSLTEGPCENFPGLVSLVLSFPAKESTPPEELKDKLS